MAERPDSVLTIEEPSRFLKMPESTLHKLAQEGMVPGQKFGRHGRFQKEAMEVRETRIAEGQSR